MESGDKTGTIPPTVIAAESSAAALLLHTPTLIALLKIVRSVRRTCSTLAVAAPAASISRRRSSMTWAVTSLSGWSPVPCYGEGTDDPSLDRTPIEPGSSVVYCLDPASHSKGTHAYPYASYVWAYDASELALVRAGQKQPWEVQPYATWSLDLPFATEGRSLGGAAYDPLTRRLFLSQECADPGGGYFCGPVIHVFELR